jgi:hypothetical protein
MRFPRLLCATAGLLTLSATAFAQSVTLTNDLGENVGITFTDATGTHSAGGFGGTFLVTGPSVVSPFQVYCVDLENDVPSSGAQTVSVTPIPVTPPLTPGQQYDPTNVTGGAKTSYTIGTYGQLAWASWIIDTATTPTNAATANDVALAKQIAIWDVIYGNFTSTSDVTLIDGTKGGGSSAFSVDSVQSSNTSLVISDAESYLTQLQAAITGGTANGTGTLLLADHTNPSGFGQDTLSGGIPTRLFNPTPEGASLLLFLPGLIPVAVGLRQRRRNKSAK